MLALTSLQGFGGEPAHGPLLLCLLPAAARRRGGNLKALGYAKAVGPLLGCPFAESFRCIRVMASAVITAGTSSFGSPRYRAGPLGHVRIRVALRRDWASRGPTSGRSGYGLQRSLTGIAGSRQAGWARRHSARNCRMAHGERKAGDHIFSVGEKACTNSDHLFSNFLGSCNVYRQRAGRVRAKR